MFTGSLYTALQIRFPEKNKIVSLFESDSWLSCTLLITPSFSLLYNGWRSSASILISYSGAGIAVAEMAATISTCIIQNGFTQGRT